MPTAVMTVPPYEWPTRVSRLLDPPQRTGYHSDVAFQRVQAVSAADTTSCPSA